MTWMNRAYVKYPFQVLVGSKERLLLFLRMKYDRMAKAQSPWVTTAVSRADDRKVNTNKKKTPKYIG